MTILLIVLGLACGWWLLADVRRLDRTDPSDRDSLDVSVIVPARNEEMTLPHLLASLARLSPAPREIIVVDDASTDETASVAEQFDVTVVRAGAKPHGWAGKPWAAATGATAASGEHLLFLDADTWLAPDALGRLWETHHDGLTSVQPFHVPERPYEQLSVVPNLVTMMGAGAGRRSRRGVRAAFGPCLFTSTERYRQVGGHEAVAGEIIEDVELAGRYRDHDLPVEIYGGYDTVRFRMYPGGFRQLIQGWTKNLAGGAGTVRGWTVAATIAWVTAMVAVTSRLVEDVARYAVGGAAPSIATLGLVIAAIVTMRVLAVRVGAFRWWVVVLFPIPLLAFVLLFFRSLAILASGRDATWKDRRVPVRGTAPA